jgi:hypothetical protein
MIRIKPAFGWAFLLSYLDKINTPGYFKKNIPQTSLSADRGTKPTKITLCGTLWILRVSQCNYIFL